MIPVKGFEGQRVAVLGLGRSGLATAEALEAGGAIALCWDDGQEARATAEQRGLTLHDLSKSDAFENIEALIVSPGIPHLYPKPNRHILRALEARVPVDNDIGLFFKSLADHSWSDFDTLPQVIAVTGSNGKSTTSALIHHILTFLKRPSQLAGNIGVGVFDIDPAHDGEVIVLELSSYQTELARALTPDIAVFTNLSPDHLDRHGGMGGYFAAKRRLFSEGGPDRAVISVDEIEGLFLAGQLSEAAQDDRVISVSVDKKLTGSGWQVFARKGFLSEYRKGRQMASIDLRAIKGLAGQHNHQNACSAYAACRALGIAPRQIEAAMHEFPGLRHRSQYLGMVNDVGFVNDSKATNIDSARAAIGAYKNIHWIVGGLGKEGGLESLKPEELKNIKNAYIIGHSAEEFALQLSDVPHERCHTLENAFAAAVKNAIEGDVVLLAPAAASFDQYPNFEKRGDAFIELYEGYSQNS